MEEKNRPPLSEGVEAPCFTWERSAAALIKALLLIAVCLLLHSCSPDTRQRAFTRRVGSHAAELTALAEEALFSGDAASGKPDWVLRDAWIDPETNCVVYEVDALGIAPSGSAWGYLYSPDGEPHPCSYWADYTRNARREDGKGWRWEDGTGNGCYVEHITGKLYFWREWW